MLKKEERILVEGMELVELYRQDPVLAARDLLNVELAPIQRVVLRDMWKKGFVILVAGRGCGKTFLLAVIAVLSCLLYPSYRTGLLGPGFRQAKLIFLEIERLWDSSSIFRHACQKKPTRGPDSCYVKFKGAGTTGSFIEALPLGVDGSKIRGSRFFTICTDEFAQVPPKIFNTVIKPMAATSRSPMEAVKEHKRQKRLLEMGLVDKIEPAEANKLIMTSSGYYKFNHMWKRMKLYWDMMDKGDENYAVWQVPITDMPAGFLNLDTIEESRGSMTEAEFLTEYMAEMVSDSDGLFKASLLEMCSVDTGFSIKLRGHREKNYVLGIDVASKQDAFAVCVVELGEPNKIVSAIERMKLSFPDMARLIYRLCNDYNVVRIFMDRFGGGESLKDILALGLDGKKAILDREDKETLMRDGDRILELCTPSTNWISDANFGTKALMEHKNLLFPQPPFGINEKEADSYDCIKKMKIQSMSIVVQENPGGSLKFTTPTKGTPKDLYSSMILAGWGINKMMQEMEEEVPYIHQGGIITPRNVNVQEMTSPITGDSYLIRR